jgi:hypothetical protein
MMVDLVVNFLVFITFDQDAIQIIGLDFNNIISSTSTLNSITSVIAMICHILSLSLMDGCKFVRLAQLR